MSRAGVGVADPRFHPAAAPLTLAEIASLTGAELADPAAAEQLVHGAGPLGSAGAGEISFVAAAKFLPALAQSNATACFITAKLAGQAATNAQLLLCDDPQLAYIRTAQRLYLPEQAARGISPAAHVDKSAQLAPGVSVAHGAVIGPGVEIGEDTIIGANTVIGAGVRIGRGCRIADQVSLSYCLVGNAVTIHSGARIGQDGFGYIPAPEGLAKMPQLGLVVIGDEVEIGANTTIDRGAGDDTTIGFGTKIDNLVQIGHNCRIGRFCIICAQCGISGSVTLGDGVVLGGSVGVADQISIGDGARIAAGSGLMKDVPAKAVQAGSPAVDIHVWRRQFVMLRKLGRDPRRKDSES